MTELLIKIGHLSKTSKMPCPSWSLSAFDCISTDEICKKICYAKRHHYNFKNVKDSLKKNKLIWLNKNWVKSMSFYVKDVLDLKYFRWFDSGDLTNILLFEKICQIADKCPNIKFWLPTRRKEILLAYFEANNNIKLNILHPNLIIRISARDINKNPDYELAKYLGVLVSSIDHNKNKAYQCKSHENNNQCGSCRVCWSKTEEVSYKLH